MSPGGTILGALSQPVRTETHHKDSSAMTTEPAVTIEQLREQLQQLSKDLEGTDAGTHVDAALVMVDRARHELQRKAEKRGG